MKLRCPAGGQDVIAREQDHLSVGAVIHHRTQGPGSTIRRRGNLAAALERSILGVVDAEGRLVALDNVHADRPPRRRDLARKADPVFAVPRTGSLRSTYTTRLTSPV